MLKNKINKSNLFISELHKERFNELSSKISIDLDVYLASLFFIVSSNNILFELRNELFDFKSRSVKSEILNHPSLTGMTIRLLSLAYELFTNNSYGDKNTVDIFEYLEDEFFDVGLNAIKIRFNKF